MIECNLCGGEWPPAHPDREIERCPWCLNPVEGDAELVGEDWKDRSGVVRAAARPILAFGTTVACYDPEQSALVHVQIGEGTSFKSALLLPLEAHRLARWILGNVDLADGEMP